MFVYQQQNFFNFSGEGFHFPVKSKSEVSFIAHGKANIMSIDIKPELLLYTYKSGTVLNNTSSLCNSTLPKLLYATCISTQQSMIEVSSYKIMIPMK